MDNFKRIMLKGQTSRGNIIGMAPKGQNQGATSKENNIKDQHHGMLQKEAEEFRIAPGITGAWTQGCIGHHMMLEEVF